MDKQTKTRVGIIGAGSMGFAHAEAYVKAGAEVCEVFDLNQGAAKSLAEKFGGHLPGSMEELLSAEVDAVSICLPHHLHHEVGLLVAESGKHALMEKPIGITPEEGRELVDAFRHRDLNLMVAFITRFYRSQIYLKKLIDEGYFGTVRLVVENLAAGGHSLPAWYSDRATAGGGILMMGTCHTVDRIGWLLDDEVQSAYAQIHPQTCQGNVEDVAGATLSYSKGTLLSVSACRSTLRDHKRTHTCCIYGTEAEARLSLEANHEQTLHLLGANGEEEMVIQDDEPFLCLVEEFLGSIREKRPPVPDGESGLQSLSAIQALYESAKTCQTQTLHP